MNEQDRKTYLERYKAAKEKGVPFFPDIIFKDIVVSFLVFIVLVALVFFIGAPLVDRANPNDTTYTPRPEWYFLFLFQILKYFPGKLEVIGAIILPSILIVLLLVLPFIDRSPLRHFRNRPLHVHDPGARALTELLQCSIRGCAGSVFPDCSEAPRKAI